MSKRFLQLAFLALMAFPALAQPAANPGTLNLRLSPDLGDALPDIQKALGALPVRIAEPADYELTTRRNYPQTLIAIDRVQQPKDWERDPRSDEEIPSRGPRTFELGNLILRDYRGGLQQLIGHAVRAKALLALQSAGHNSVESCFAWARPSNNVTVATCHFPDEPPLAIPGDEDPGSFAVRVRNRSAEPRYVAVLAVEPLFGIQRLPLDGIDNALPLAPGAIAQTSVAQLLNYGSEHVSIVTISSDRPIDVAAFVQPTLNNEDVVACENSAEDCPPATLKTDTSGWSVSIAEQAIRHAIIGEMGGGASAVEGMAPWMAEFYSTVPYTKAEIAADAQKPKEERQYLAELNPRERAHRCGGSLIASNFVLTAAHCVAKGHYTGAGMARVMAERRVRIGTIYLGSGGTTYAIVGVAVPKNYSPDRQDNDIALLLIKPDRDTKPLGAPPVSVGSRPLRGGTRLTAFGWGYTGEVAAGANTIFSVADDLQHYAEELQFGAMTALDRVKCQQKLGDKYANGMVCLVAPDPGHNVFSCRGDSGGPLIRKVGHTRELVGITSWSMGCGHDDYPSVYTDVTKYRSWIVAARQQLTPGAAITVDDPAAPGH